MSTHPRIKVSPEEWEYLTDLVSDDVEHSRLAPTEAEQARGLLGRLTDRPDGEMLRLRVGPGQAVYLVDLLEDDLRETDLTEDEREWARHIQHLVISRHPGSSPRRRMVAS